MQSIVSIQQGDAPPREYPRGITSAEILKDLRNSDAKTVVAASVNGEIVDLARPIVGDAEVRFLTTDDPEGMSVYWHSSAHIMAHAIKELMPTAKFAIGPPIEAGFYYDVELDRPLTPEDLEAIEGKMREIIKANRHFTRKELSKEEAIALFGERNEDYKLEILSDLDDEQPSVYWEGDFVDLCRGPHVQSTGKVRHFKLLSIAGAYWRGDENNKMLQRIYGISFPKKDSLDDHLARLEEARKRDHRRLGRELDLFSITDEIGGGLVLWHPNGAMVRKTIEDYWRDEHLKGGYQLLFTPHIARSKLWDTSGHLDFFKENMFSPMQVENQEYLVKPMNCPFHLSIYKSQRRSYRELPVRYAELGTVYRYERSGVLHGLMRVRGFTQDDAHIFCRQDQLEEEILAILDFNTHILSTFGFDGYKTFLSTRPQKYVGTPENWELATAALCSALERKGMKYEVDPGEGVFYGPKIDIKIQDALNRSWQCSTIQVDFNEPERFNLTYVGEDAKAHQPIMIHRALFGSLERFFGVLIEHYAGAFPLWLAPLQVAILPITDNQLNYAEDVRRKLADVGIRASVDSRNEKVGYKIRGAETKKTPYMLIVGNREAERNEVSVRKRKVGDQGSMGVAEFRDAALQEIRDRS